MLMWHDIYAAIEIISAESDFSGWTLIELINDICQIKKKQFHWYEFNPVTINTFCKC